MAVTKILARNARLDQAIQYVLNGDKTDDNILTAHQNCDPGRECRQMMDTKRAFGKLDGRQCYHMIQSFKPGEITPELALEIAKEFAAEYLTDYEVVIGTHIDKGHIHSHLVFNSVNAQTGEKYHVTNQEYYRQIRATSDRLCREHRLSVIMEGQSSQAVSYVEWLRQSKGQPTFRTMLEADLRTAIESANDLGHFFLLMEHMGYEIYHGNRLGFRLRGQDRFMYPGRKNPLFTEDGIRAAIQGNLEAIEAGHRPAAVRRPAYRPYKKHPKYTGLLALYVHYLYVLGKVGQRRYPPRMTAQTRQEAMKFERYRAQFAFLRENSITTQEDMTAFQFRTEETLASLTKQRTILNVRKKKRRSLYDALADVDALAPAKQCYEDGLSGMEAEFTRYMDAMVALERCHIPKENLMAEKSEVYLQLAEINRQIRSERKKLALCREICARLPQMEREINQIEAKEMMRDDDRGGEAADQMVRMMLSGGAVAVRLGGSALKNLLALTMALAKNNQTISGKVNMTRMLQETRDLRLFPMTPEQYKQFARQAKKQKILFSAIKDKDDRGKLVDVVMPVTELDRANLIFERIMYQGPVRQAPERERQAPEQDEREPERDRSERSPEQDRQPPQRAQEGRQEERSGEDGPASQPEQESPSGRDFRPEWTAKRSELPDDPWEIPPKKDSRSEPDSPGTKTRSFTRRTSNGETTMNDRPSLLGRLEAYQAQLSKGRQSVPTREKAKSKPKQR